MIFDVARHKFSEGLVTLMLFALVAVFAALRAVDIEVVTDGAPLSAVIELFTISHPVLTALLMFSMLVYAGLRYARVAVRIGLYSTSTLGLLALGGVAMFACTSYSNYLSLMVIVLLGAELFGRLFYCFGVNMKMSYLFTAMLSLGLMPLVDSALIPFVLALSLVVIFIRGTVRETIIILFGLALPTFIYCYLVWLFGGEFDAAFVDIWQEVNAAVGQEALVAYMTLSRMVFLGITLLLSIASLVVYYSVRVTLVDSSRVVWRLLIALLIMLLAMLFLMPSASPAIVVILVLVMTLMLPQLFIRLDVITTSIVYLIWVISALATLA